MTLIGSNSKPLMIRDWNTYVKWPTLLRRWTPEILVINTASNNTLFIALFITLNAPPPPQDLPPNFLDNGFHHVLPGEFPRDLIKGEFGIYRQQIGGKVYISVDQVLSGLHLQLKLFKKLLIKPKKEPCFEKRFSETELGCLDNCFELSNNLIESKKSALYMWIYHSQRRTCYVRKRDTLD